MRKGSSHHIFCAYKFGHQNHICHYTSTKLHPKPTTSTRPTGIQLGGTMANPPADAQWIRIDQNTQNIQDLGRFAVEKHNEEHHSKLYCNSVNESWNMTISSDYGNLYLLHLTAPENDVLANFHAIVWVRHDESDPKKLVSFKQL